MDNDAPLTQIFTKHFHIRSIGKFTSAHKDDTWRRTYYKIQRLRHIISLMQEVLDEELLKLYDREIELFGRENLFDKENQTNGDKS